MTRSRLPPRRAFPARAGMSRKHAHRRISTPSRLRTCIDFQLPRAHGSYYDGRADAA